MVPADQPACPLCHKNHYNCHATRELFTFCKILDQLIKHNETQNCLLLIQKSTLRHQPMVQFRKARVLFQRMLSDSQPLTKNKLMFLVGVLLPLTTYPAHYGERLLPYLVSLLPSPAIRLHPDECRDILFLIDIPRLDQYAILRKKLMDQLFLSEN